MGDLISSLCGIKNYCEENGVKAIIYQLLDVKNDYYFGAVHPVKDSEGNQVCMNQSTYKFIKPLIIEQDYIEDYVIYIGQEVDFDLDKVRHEVFVNLPSGAIQNWNGLWFPELQGDISKKWISINGYIWEFKSIIINFTERYRNPYITYYFLKPYEKQLMFVGTEREHELFTKRWALDIEHFKSEDSFFLAEIIFCAKFVLCNQSMVYNLAQAMHVPRLLELCAQFPNCIHGIGKHSYGYYHQHTLEQLFKKLFNMEI